MSDPIRFKYNNIIDSLVKKVDISPKDYKDKKNLNKRWVVYFRYQTASSDKKKKYSKASYKINSQYIEVNRINDHKEKIKHIEFLKNAIIFQLKNDTRFVLTLVYGKEEAIKRYPNAFSKHSDVTEPTTVENALEKVLATKKDLSSTYYNDLKSIKNRFIKYVGSNKNEPTSYLTKKIIVSFLNDVTVGKSSRTYNNIKTNLKTLLEGLKDLDYIERNFLDGVKNKQTKAKRNVAFTIEQKEFIFKEAKKHDELLYFFLLHVYYELMRPQTVVRIKVKDIDLKSMMFKTNTKTGKFNKLILKPLHDEFYSKLNLSSANKEHYIFGLNNFITEWSAKDENRRQNYTDRFKKIIKDPYFKNSEYTIYSLRHTAIGVAFKNKCQELQQQKVYNYKKEAVKWIMQFTEHKTEDETLIYLRGISTDIVEDWSNYL
ncbi:hypothetical protein C7H52_06225 [Aurantibacter aestuarii]|uniref:Tyr recombinase domain-containing protein n=2 Tax=Aurantibacter aestuarii TaxID=1266046 RepID=A0A2T1NEQ7_9FLAO|nr:hypothetical protein C7H52_06225 [Aurantibacter aestuarii]